MKKVWENRKPADADDQNGFKQTPGFGKLEKESLTARFTVYPTLSILYIHCTLQTDFLLRRIVLTVVVYVHSFPAEWKSEVA